VGPGGGAGESHGGDPGGEVGGGQDAGDDEQVESDRDRGGLRFGAGRDG
jgi:hypothetical protein